MADKELWDLLGRGSPAGKALFNVYNGDSAGKKAGGQFHKMNRRTHEKKLASGWTPPESVASRDSASVAGKAKKVSVPKVGRGAPATTSELIDERGRTYYHYQLRWGGRRSKADIIREMEREWADQPVQPQPSKPVMDDAEKDRLVTMMRFRGQPPEVTPEEIANQLKTRKSGVEKTRMKELEDLFAQAVDEIDERREFLESMRAQGKAGKYERQIRLEIQERVQDLKKIDELIQAEGGAS